jgi:hypothetical protein
MRKYLILLLLTIITGGCVTGSEFRETVTDRNALVVRVGAASDPRSFLELWAQTLCAMNRLT